MNMTELQHKAFKILVSDINDWEVREGDVIKHQDSTGYYAVYKPCDYQFQICQNTAFGQSWVRSEPVLFDYVFQTKIFNFIRGLYEVKSNNLPQREESLNKLINSKEQRI